MKHSFDVDFTVQVREQVRDEDPEFARFYQGIYSVALNRVVNLMFIPYFSREVKDWSLRIPDNIDEVHSVQEARIYTAALAEYTVMPDEFRAGEEELIALPPPLPPCPDMGRREGVIFYVTPQQFMRFSQELVEIEQLAFPLYATVRASKISHFECIKFIKDIVITSKHFSENSLRMLGRHKSILNGRPTPHTQIVNGDLIESKEMPQHTALASPWGRNGQEYNKQPTFLAPISPSKELMKDELR